MRKGVDNINRNKLYVLGAIFALIMCISGIYAITNTTNVTVDNDMRTGGVNIKLDEYLVTNGQEVEYTEAEKIVVPGEQVPLIPRISNLAAPCYLRVKLSYTINGNITYLTQESLGEMSSDFKKVDDYWYYTKPLAQNDKLDVFKYLVIPTNMGNEDQGKTLQFNIIAEAIQSNNVDPDFDSTNPWGNAEILKNDDENYVMEKIQVSDAVKVEYDNDAAKILNVPDDFMAGLSELMPGDEITYTVPTSENPFNATYLFKILPDNLDDADVKDLLQHLQLVIKKDGTTVYDGNMDVTAETAFGSAEAYQTPTFTFTVKMPIELNNTYAMRRAPIKWNFTLRLNRDEPLPPNYTNSYSVDIVKVGDDGKTPITSGKAVFDVDGTEVDTTDGVANAISDKVILKEGQIDTITIKEKTAPNGYNKYDGEIKLKIGFKFDSNIEKFAIDPEKVECTAPGISTSGIYKIVANATEQRITVYVTNNEIIPEPEGKYTVELVKVAEDGTTVISNSESVFTINNSNIATEKGKLTIASNKEITSVSQKDTYTITEKTAPKGFNKYNGKITLKVGFKVNEADNTYVIDESKTSIDAPGLSGSIYKVSADKIIVYVPNKKIPPKPVPSPQTGDVKIKIAIAIFVIAALGLILIFVLEKRNKDKNKDK